MRSAFPAPKFHIHTMVFNPSKKIQKNTRACKMGKINQNWQMKKPCTIFPDIKLKRTLTILRLFDFKNLYRSTTRGLISLKRLRLRAIGWSSLRKRAKWIFTPKVITEKNHFTSWGPLIKCFKRFQQLVDSFIITIYNIFCCHSLECFSRRSFH